MAVCVVQSSSCRQGGILPKDRPATKSGTMPISFSTAVIPAAKATIQGWV